MERLLNIHEAAEQLAMHPDTVRKLLRRGDLQGIKMPGLRGAWKVRPADIERFVNRHIYHP